MRFFTLFLLLSLWLMPADATDRIYHNTEEGTTSPQVDATIFWNEGTFFASGQSLYETLNTRFWTNSGTGIMSGTPGFWFNYSVKGQRRVSDVIHNDGLIEARDGSTATGVEGEGFTPTPTAARLRLWATNIVNRGVLDVTDQGLIEILGDKIDLYLSGLRAERPLGGFSEPRQFLDADRYENVPGVTDLYWGAGMAQVLGGRIRPLNLLSGDFDVPFTRTPVHQVLVPGGRTNNVSLPSLSFDGFTATALTNTIDATTRIVQVVFVATNSLNTNITVSVGFSPGQDPDSFGSSAIVGFETPDYDPVFDVPFTNFVYLVDHSAWTNRNIIIGGTGSGTFSRPSVYELYRSLPSRYGQGTPGNRPFSYDMIYNPSYSNRVVTNLYAAYSARIGNPPPGATAATNSSSNPALSDPANGPGRIEVKGKDVDVSFLRLRSQGQFTLNASNYVGNPELIDASLLSLNLGSTNGNLTITNIAQATVKRLVGELACYSAVWTNFQTQVTETSTNTINVKFHVLVVDQSFNDIVPVRLRDLTLKSENVVLQDTFNVTERLRIDVRNLTVDPAAVLQFGSFQSVGPTTNFIQLNSLTNHGLIFFNQGVEFSLTNRPLASFYNQGLLESGSLILRADSLINRGSIYTDFGPMLTFFDTAVLQNGILGSRGDIRLTGRSLTVGNTLLQAGGVATNFLNGQVQVTAGSIVVDVSESISDQSEFSGAISEWDVINGVRLVTKPRVGDLLRTVIYNFVPKFRTSTFTWAGEDRGVSPTGYQDNAAVGHLILDIERRGSRITFTGASQANALYVDYLELRGEARDFSNPNVIEIASNMVIYFNTSNVDPSILESRSDGRVRRAPYSGPSMSSAGAQAPVAAGATRRAPSTLAPVAVSIQMVELPEPSIKVSWEAPAHSISQLEGSTLVGPALWERVGEITQGNINGPVSIVLPLSNERNRKQFFRVRLAK